MAAYADTSFLVAVYSPQADSAKALTWMQRARDPPAVGMCVQCAFSLTDGGTRALPDIFCRALAVDTLKGKLGNSNAFRGRVLKSGTPAQEARRCVSELGECEPSADSRQDTSRV